MERLYIITRRDLPPGAELVQSCHALRAFVGDHPELDSKWHSGANNLVCLDVQNLAELQLLAARCSELGLAMSCFHEPDLEGTLTAIAVEDKVKRVVSQLPRALRDVKAAA